MTLAVAALGYTALEASPARADDEAADPNVEVRPPSWFLTVGGGGTGNSSYEPEFMDMTIKDRGLLGLVLDLSSVRDHVAFNADIEAYPLGGVYGGRASMLIGGHWFRPYVECWGTT